ncbi:MAG: Na+/H+ antiporter NhaA [Alphaproteobacteria bacterium]
MPKSWLHKILRDEAASGIVLLLAGSAGLILANTPLADFYHAFWRVEFLGIHYAGWINDALIPVFYLVVGLEIKREMGSHGSLSDWRRASLPIIAALGGMVAPAIVYFICVAGHPEFYRGWAVPAATDIAFAVGIMALLAKRLPPSLRVFMLTLAIVDDLGSILIIGLFYAGQLDALYVGNALAIVGAMWGLRRLKIDRAWPYLLLSVPLWYCVHHSGIHATIAGVILAFALPRASGKKVLSALHAWVAFAILPVFAFANAGVTLKGMTIESLDHPVFWGIVLGMFLGKQIGIFSAIAVAVKSGISRLPPHAGWAQVYGMSILGGVGFTMALFIGSLSFQDGALIDRTRLAIMTGSFLAAVMGYMVLFLTSKRSSRHGA